MRVQPSLFAVLILVFGGYAALGAMPDTLSLPAPVEWATVPVGAAAAPGDPYPVTFADLSGSVDPGAPVIAEWNRTAMPGESFAITGVRFTERTGNDAGTDTTVWIWGNTASGGSLRQAKVWRVTNYALTALVPPDLPCGMYLVWVENAAGASAPVCLNRPLAQWIGPLGNTASPGDKRRVFGKNISYAHGTTTSYVYMQPAGGGAITALAVSKVDPYSVEFTIPTGTPNGSYSIYVHNGQGGRYGWGDPLSLTVQSHYVRGTDEIVLNPSGGDDTAAIQSALDTMAQKTSGGTVRLGAGEFTVSDQVWLNHNVRMVGAGMDQTTIEWRMGRNANYCLKFMNDHISVEDLTLKQCATAYKVTSGFFGQGWPEYDYSTYTLNDYRLTRVRVSCEAGIQIMSCSLLTTRCEVDSCEFSGDISTGRRDGWIHDSILYGSPYWEAEAPAGGDERAVFERNQIRTPDWPIGPNNSRNYIDFIPQSELGNYIWAKRVWLSKDLSQGWSKNQYIAWNTATDCAIQDNRGEMVLYHGGPGAWFGQCLVTVGNTTTVRTDGLINTPSGPQSYTATAYQVNPIPSGQPVPDSFGHGFPIDGGLYGSEPVYMIIIGGAGMGQSRQIVTHTANTITVSSPWRVPPDSTSVATLSPMYCDCIIYKNDLSGFPVGYRQTSSASCPVDIDGNGWGIEVEANTSHRTSGSYGISANAVGVGYWCTMRNNQALEVDRSGSAMGTWEKNPFGYCNTGSMFHGGSVTLTGLAPIWSITGGEDGNTFEGMTLASGPSPGLIADAEVVLRNNIVTTATAGQGVYFSKSTANPILIGNTYSAGQTYYLVPGCTFAQKPLPEYRVARFKGYVGTPVGDVMVPIANAGIQGMTCVLSPSDSWITTAMPIPTVAQEAETGRLIVSVDTTGMSAGRHWGYIDISTGSKSARVGVCVDLVPGPANQPPSASFSAAPLVGTPPMTVSFNAAPSSDPDGSISSYTWDFGDGATASGVMATHAYTSAGTYAVVLTVTDDEGASDVAYTNVVIVLPISNITLSGSPAAPIDPGTPVTLTATSTGGYQVQYKFAVNDGSGWHTIRDYQNDNTCTWTPSSAANYVLRVYVREASGTSQYDAQGPNIVFPVGTIPGNGMTLWLKAGQGVIYDGNAKVSAWADQSKTGGNSVSQSYSAYRPSYVQDSGNGRASVKFTSDVTVMATGNRVFTGTNEFTCLAVLKYNGSSAPASNEYVMWNGVDNSTTGGYGIWVGANQCLSAGWGYFAAQITDTSAMNQGEWYVLTSRYGGGSHRMWVNGVSKGTISKSNSNITSGSFSVGNKGPAPTQAFDGDIQEVIIYNRALTDVERAAVEAYLSTVYQPQSATTISALKGMYDGTSVSLTSAKSVTAATGTFLDGSCYIGEPDRANGIKVAWNFALGSALIGDMLTLTGTVGTDANGDKVFFASKVNTYASGTSLGPLGILNKNTPLCGGLLVRVWGKVVSVDPAGFTLDDGSGTPTRVDTSGLAPAHQIDLVPSSGQYAAATGVVAKAAGGTTVVRPRGDSDVTVISSP